MKPTPTPSHREEVILPVINWKILLAVAGIVATATLFGLAINSLLQSTEASSASVETVTASVMENIITIDNVPLADGFMSEPPHLVRDGIDLQVAYKASQKMVEIKANSVPENMFAKVRLYDENGVILFFNGKDYSKDVLLRNRRTSFITIFPDETMRPMGRIERMDMMIYSKPPPPPPPPPQKIKI